MLKIIDHKLFSGNTVREIQMCRPPVNAFNTALLTALKEAILNAPLEGIRGLVISGGGNVFSAGMDIKETAVMDREDITEIFQALKDVTLAVGLSELPIGFAITGNCMGAAAVFALFCDYRVMSKGLYSYGITEVRGGMRMSPHMIYALTRIVGEHTAQRIILEARVFESKKAYEMGLIDDLVSHQLVRSRAVAWCDRMLKLPHKAMKSTRDITRAGLVEKLGTMAKEPMESRVDEWFKGGMQKSFKKLLRASAVTEEQEQVTKKASS